SNDTRAAMFVCARHCQEGAGAGTAEGSVVVERVAPTVLAREPAQSTTIAKRIEHVRRQCREPSCEMIAAIDCPRTRDVERCAFSHQDEARELDALVLLRLEMRQRRAPSEARSEQTL